MHVASAEIAGDDGGVLNSSSAENAKTLHIGGIDAGHASSCPADVAGHHIVIDISPEADAMASAGGRCAIVEGVGTYHGDIGGALDCQQAVGAVVQQSAAMPRKPIDSRASIETLASTG